MKLTYTLILFDLLVSKGAFKNLKIYNLEGNGLSEIPQNIKDITNAHIYMSGNTVDKRPPLTVVLTLKNNNIGKIPTNIFHYLTKCQILYLNHNKITVIEDGAFRGLSALRKLYLNNNIL